MKCSARRPARILSATAPYQKGLRQDEYEVIVVDNGSRTPLTYENLPSNASIVRAPSPRQSPVFALNWAARDIAKGDILLLCRSMAPASSLNGCLRKI